MDDIIKNDSHDDISEMIESTAGTPAPASPKELEQAMSEMASLYDEEKENDLVRRQSRQVYKLDVVRDGSDDYFKALTDAILAITDGDYGCIDYKGYQIYFSDTPHVKSISLADGSKEYSYWISFKCDALRVIHYEEYNSEDERKAYRDPENELFKTTLALLDKQIEELDDGTWIKKKKSLHIFHFKDYSAKELRENELEWKDLEKDASNTLSFLMEDAMQRTNGVPFTEEDFDIFADVIRRMVFFADYGKRNYLFVLEGFIRFNWKPKTKRDNYIWRCMDTFGQGVCPDKLLDNCAIYYFLDDPQGWESQAYLLPIVALGEMCRGDYEPDRVKELMLKIFSIIPDRGYVSRIEKLIEEDRAKANKGESNYDQEDN